MERFDARAEDLSQIVARIQSLGAVVREDLNEPEGARFVGTFENNVITLFPRYDSILAQYFTVAHLYGHMAQLARPTPVSSNTFSYAGREGTPLAESEIQSIYDYELEAARIGRTVMAQTHVISAELDRQYSRLFFADFHYLVHFIETGESGVETFGRFWRREPVPWTLLTPHHRELINFNVEPVSGGSAVVV